MPSPTRSLVYAATVAASRHLYPAGGFSQPTCAASQTTAPGYVSAIISPAVHPNNESACRRSERLNPGVARCSVATNKLWRLYHGNL